MVRCQICEAWTLAFFYLISFFFFLFFILRSRVRIRVMSYSHTITWNRIEGSEKMTSYNMCKTHVDLKANTQLFRVG